MATDPHDRVPQSLEDHLRDVIGELRRSNHELHSDIRDLLKLRVENNRLRAVLEETPENVDYIAGLFDQTAPTPSPFHRLEARSILMHLRARASLESPPATTAVEAKSADGTKEGQ